MKCSYNEATPIKFPISYLSSTHAHLFLSAIKFPLYRILLFIIFSNASKAHKLILYECQLTCLNWCNCAFKV